MLYHLPIDITSNALLQTNHAESNAYDVSFTADLIAMVYHKRCDSYIKLHLHQYLASVIIDLSKRRLTNITSLFNLNAKSILAGSDDEITGLIPVL